MKYILLVLALTASSFGAITSTPHTLTENSWTALPTTTSGFQNVLSTEVRLRLGDGTAEMTIDSQMIVRWKVGQKASILTTTAHNTTVLVGE